MVSTVAGKGAGYADGNKDTAMFQFPYGVATDRSDNVYIADSDNHGIRKITPQGITDLITISLLKI
jgi:hypothetical protein